MDGNGENGADEECDHEEDADIDLGVVRWRQNRGRWSLWLSWQDANGERHSNWETPRKGNVKHVVESMNALRPFSETYIPT